MTKSNVIPFPSRPKKPATFKDFAEQIMAGNTTKAGQSLAQLFSIAPEVAERCANFYLKRIEENPAVLEDLFNLKTLLMANQHNESIQCLVKNFDLSYTDAVVVVGYLLKSNAVGSTP